MSRVLGGSFAQLGSLPPRVVAGLAWGLLTVLCTVAMLSIALPPPGSVDAYWHLDYVYQLWHGHLPQPYGGEWTPPGQVGPPESRGGVHYTAAHPPLFYLVALPVVGPLFATQNLMLITVAARAVNVAVGVALFAALARLGWHLGGRVREPLAVALPTVTMLLVPIAELAGEFYNDLLVTLAVVVGLTEAVLALQGGLRTRHVVVMTVAATIGLGTKATFVFTLLLLLAVPPVAHLLHGAGPAWRRLVRGIGPSVVIGAAPTVAWAWFYYRNWRFSGSPLSGVVESDLPGGTHRTVSEALAMPQWWLEFAAGWLGARPWNGILGLNLVLATVVFMVALVASVVYWRRQRPDRASRVIAAMLVLQVLALWGAQFYHLIGTGSLNWRYLMPAAFVLGMVLLAGVVGSGPRVAAWGTGGLVVVLAASGAYDRALYVMRRFVPDASSPLDAVLTVPTAHHVPVAVWCALTVGVAVSGMCTARAVGRLRASAPAPTSV